MSKSPVDLTSRSTSRPSSVSRPVGTASSSGRSSSAEQRHSILSSYNLQPRSSTSPVRPPSRTAALNLGSPITSPAKAPTMSQASRHVISPTRDEQGGIPTRSGEEKPEGKSGRLSVIVAEEREVMELVDTPPAADGDVDMNGDETVDEDGDEGEGEGEDEGEDGEGDGEGEGGEEGSGSDEDEDDEEEEDDEEDDEEDSGDESEDLGGSPEIVAIDGPSGPPRLSLPPTVKTEPGEEGGTAPAGPDEIALAEAGAVTAEGEVNVLAPKKKKRVRPRSPSEDVDLPPPPPPMRTIRLESKMLPEGETLEWDILEDARTHGMVAEVWAVAEDDMPIKEGEEGAVTAGVQADGQGHEGEANGLSNGPGPAGPSSGPLFGLGFGDEDPEEIARRLEEKYGEDNRKSKKAKFKKKKPIDYDLNDPFIDDSEIMIDAPTHYARPKKEGFFVHSGMLELLEESPVKAKPRTTKAKARTSNAVPAPPKPPRRSLSAAVLSHKRRGSGFKGSEAEPISIDDSDGETKAAGPSKLVARRSGSLSPSPRDDDVEKDEDLDLQPVEIDRVLYKNASKDPALLPPYLMFAAAVRRRLNALRGESEKHDWSHGARGKFPDHLRPFLQAAGRAAYEHDLFGLADREGVDKSFFLALPSALPYNEFTLRKLVTKLCYTGYWIWLQDCEEEGIEQFKDMVNQEKDDILAKYEEAHKAWEVEVKEWDENHPNAVANGNTPSSNSQAEPMAIDALINGPSAGTITGTGTPRLDDARPAEPPKRFPWTADMREVFGQLLENMSDIVDLAKRATEWNIQSAKAGKEWGETGTKIRLYKKVNDCFPDGFMNTSIISREMTKLRGNKKKQQVDQDGDGA
ncbi:hypothetical protein IAT40_003126 [Kwoniella sp. CBS 6097]